MALTTVQFVREKQFAYGNRPKPVHGVLSSHMSDRWETLCGVGMLSRSGRLLKGTDPREITCGECRALIDDRRL